MLLGVVVLLIVGASTAPWSGWRDLGVSPFAYLVAPVPLHVTQFDLVMNVLGYLPLGALAVLAMHPRFRGTAAFGLAVLAGALLSGAVEAVQTFLPERVASNLDLATNTCGAAVGAALVGPWTRRLIDGARLAHWRAQWFVPDATTGLLLVAAWPALQVDATPMLFGNGAVRRWLAALAGVFSGEAGTVGSGADERLLGALQVLPPSAFLVAEVLVVAAAVLAAGLTLAALMRPAAPRVGLLLGLLGTALSLRGIAYAGQFGAERALIWVTPGAVLGLSLGLCGLLLASRWSPRTRLLLALLAAVVMIGVVNGVPPNPYHVAWRQTWHIGRLAHISAVLELLAASWPFVVLGWGATRLATGRT